MPEKSLSERVADFVEGTGKSRKKNQLLWLLHGDEVVEAVASGMPKKWVWETLQAEGRYSASYQYFVIQLRQYTQKGSKQLSNIVKPVQASTASGKRTGFELKRRGTEGLVPKESSSSSSGKKPIFEIPHLSEEELIGQ